MSTSTRARIDPRLRERRVAVQRERGRRRLRILGAAVALGLVGVAAYGIARSPLLAVESIAVEGANHADADAIRAASGIDDGDPILFVDLGAARRGVEEVPWVATAHVTRELAHTIRIEVTERVPVAWFATVDGGQVVVDASGRMLGVASASMLPELVGLQTSAGTPGEDVEPAGLAGVVAALPEALRSRVVAVVRADEGGQPGATLALADGPEVRLGRLEHIAEKGSAALAVLGALGEGTPTYLDVRVPSAPVTG